LIAYLSGSGSLAANPSAEAPLISGEPVARRPVRALIGWLNEPEALSAMLGRVPTPADDLTSLRKLHLAYQQAVQLREPYKAEEPRVDISTPELESVLGRPDVRSVFAGLNWKPAMVDLRKVLSFQKLISIEGLDERLSGVSEPDSLLDLCLPRQQSTPPLGAFADPDGKGFTVSSVNPNLRIAAGQVSDALVNPSPELPPVKMQAITLLVFMGQSFLQVVRYRDRSFVRDGYHRTAGLLKRQIYVVPCIFVEAQSFEQISAPSGSFTYEILFGDRPPMLSDFWDDAVSREIEQVAVRKVVRVRGEEFVVPR
jgi:hypothetical protein